MKPEEKHAAGMWLVAAFLGGFALLLWWTGRLDREAPVPATPPAVERSDSTA